MWNWYLLMPLEIKIILWLLGAAGFLFIAFVIWKKGISFNKKGWFKLGGKSNDRYITITETVKLINKTINTVVEKSQIQFQSRIKDQLNFADQEHLFIKDLYVDKFIELLKERIKNEEVHRHKGTVNYAKTIRFLLKDLIEEHKRYFKSYQTKDSFKTIKEDFDNPNSELSKKANRQANLAYLILTDLIKNNYTEEEYLSPNHVFKENEKLSEKIKEILYTIIQEGMLIHGHYNDRLKELDSSLTEYVRKLTE